MLIKNHLLSMYLSEKKKEEIIIEWDTLQDEYGKN